MKPTKSVFFAATACAIILSGCGHKHDHNHSNAEEGHSHNADGSHSDSAQSFSGATHTEDGITLLDETRELLGIQTTEVQEKALPRTVQFTARVFDSRDGDTSLASGMVAINDVALLPAGLSVQFRSASDVNVTGMVQQVTQPVANGEAEVIVSLPSTTNPLKRGEFGEATVSVPGEKPSLVVPRKAVINGVTGNLVYVVNGDAYTLTWIELGAEAEGWVEVTDGLLVGDRVVTRGVMDLWLVELRAVKGGQGCCPAPPKKGAG